MRFVLVSLGLLLLASEHAADTGTRQDQKKLLIGETVPDFEVTIDGKRWRISELRKNAELTREGTLVLTFWCTFCHSCRHVEHRLDELATKYKGQAAVIALDASAGETTEGVTEFAKKNGLSLPIALTSGKAADLFGVNATTTTVIIDGQGRLRYRGRFADGQTAYAEDATRCVLAGQEVPHKETPQKG